MSASHELLTAQDVARAGGGFGACSAMMLVLPCPGGQLQRQSTVGSVYSPMLALPIKALTMCMSSRWRCVSWSLR